MKRTFLFLSTALLTLPACAQEQQQKSTPVVSENNTSTVSVPSKTIQVKASVGTASIKPGDMLNLSEFMKMPNGIMYRIIKKGLGSKPINGENLTVNYSGYLLLDGKKVGLKFDSSLDRNQPFTFKLGARMVIPGWEATLADMKIGETRIVILPSSQAYGKRATASIPADSTLIFEITLLKAS